MRPARRQIRLLDLAFPGFPARDVAFSRAWLDRVASGEAPETFRLYRPDDVVAFSALDAASPGLQAALAAARGAGFQAALRLAGGRAAVFHRDTLAFAWTIPAADPREGIHARFDEIAAILESAFRRLGVDARVGEVPGEYCPGRHSVNARGLRKLAGVGQRVIRGAAHVGGVIVVDGSERVRDALVAVYDALGLPWDPATAGSIADEIGPTRCEDVAAAVRAELDARFAVDAGVPGLAIDAALAEAERLEQRFRLGAHEARASAASDPQPRSKTLSELV